MKKNNLYWNRRDFLTLFGKTAAAAALAPLATSCCHLGMRSADLPFTPLAPSDHDQLLLAEGLSYDVLISWQDPLNDRGLKFGFNNDFTAFVPLATPNEGILWVNHESVDPVFASRWTPSSKRSRTQVAAEMREVGGSLIHIRFSEGRWQLVKNSRYNRRLDAHTPIPIIAPRPIEGAQTAIGTLANCAGGQTPWGTILTCEENYDMFFGERFHKNGERTWQPGKDYLGWREFFAYPPEHYGWVVEVNPLTGAAKKLTGLGRFSHECATVTVAKDGRAVVYSGDDRNDECLYKFISQKPGSLEQGELFVANTKEGRWISLNIHQQPKLKAAFKDQTEVQIRCREAARLVGATLLDRPEDVEIDPANRDVYVTLTNNKDRGNLHGSILKISEQNNDPLSLNFTATTFMTGSADGDFSCPDNMVFDRKGNLWMTNDISDSSLNKGEYKKHGNNSLFYIPLSGPGAGQAHRVASAPVNAELTGPTFSPDGRTLFLSVQHPGEGTTNYDSPLSHWPNGGTNTPRPSVVTISGPLLDRLVNG